MSQVNRGPEPYQSGTPNSTHLSQFYALPTVSLELSLSLVPKGLGTRLVVSQIDGAVRAYAYAYDDHYLTRSKFNSLLTEMITPQT